MIAAIIGILAGGLGLTALVDNFAGTELTAAILDGLWSVLQFVLSPLLMLLSNIWDKLLEIVRSLFF